MQPLQQHLLNNINIKKELLIKLRNKSTFSFEYSEPYRNFNSQHIVFGKLGK